MPIYPQCDGAAYTHTYDLCLDIFLLVAAKHTNELEHDRKNLTQHMRCKHWRRWGVYKLEGKRQQNAGTRRRVPYLASAKGTCGSMQMPNATAKAKRGHQISGKPRKYCIPNVECYAVA